MQAGVSGLFAQSTKMSMISDNISNSNTVGYKRTFADLVSVTANGGDGGIADSSVRPVGRGTVDQAGSLESTNTVTDLAIGGRGFFVVSKDPTVTTSDNFMLTRAGGFRIDSQGYLTNDAGYYLNGFPYNAGGTVGVVDRNSFASVQPVKIANVSMVGSPTTQMTMTGNLPAQQTGLATPPSPFVTSTEFFSPLGVSQRFNMSWQPTATADKWTLTVTDTAGNSYGSVDVAFNNSGANAGSPATYSNVVNSATAPAAFAFNAATGQATITVNNGTVPQLMTCDLGAPNTFNGISQFAGDYTVQVAKDGATSGNMTRIEIDQQGTIYGVFDSGLRKPMYQLPVADVLNPNGLAQADGNAYMLSKDSGTFSLKDAGASGMGTINSSSLEMSNVDIAQELTNLIQTQRAYSSDTKVVQTADEMLQETTQLKR
jgi:flagellar hook protein FlgE